MDVLTDWDRGRKNKYFVVIQVLSALSANKNAWKVLLDLGNKMWDEIFSKSRSAFMFFYLFMIGTNTSTQLNTLY